MASIPPQHTLWRFLSEPLRGPALLICGTLVWLLGAAYCHGYESLLSGGIADWSGSLIWSAIAVVPWFGLWEWSKQPQGTAAARRPAQLAGLVIAIALLSIVLEYSINASLGDVSDRLGLLVMRRLPAIGVSILLIALSRSSMLRRAPEPPLAELVAVASAIDWVEAADNYIEVHSAGAVSLRRMTMRDAANALQRHGFVRIHRRYLVNRRRIAGVGDRAIRLDDGRELPVGTAFAANLRELG